MNAYIDTVFMPSKNYNSDFYSVYDLSQSLVVYTVRQPTNPWSLILGLQFSLIVQEKCKHMC